MPQVFSSNPLPGDVWDMSGAVITFGSGSTNNIATSLTGAPLIALGLQLAFGRGISKRYPINVRRVIYMLGNPDGTLTMNALFGPNNSMSAFLATYNSLGANAESTGNGSGNSILTIKPYGKIVYAGSNAGVQNNADLGLGIWKVIDPVITNIGLTVSESSGSQIPAIAQVTMSFSNLEIN